MTFQEQVKIWTKFCFSKETAMDKTERNHRFLEEALELVQSLNCTKEEAHSLVDYVYGRPVGEPKQEVGGVLLTLNALCTANDINCNNAGRDELIRVWVNLEKIRKKQAAKPKNSPLPQ